MTTTNRAAEDLIFSLERLQNALEGEAHAVANFVAALRKESAEGAEYVGSSIDANVLSLVVGTFNTSNKVSAAEASIRYAQRLAAGKE